MNDFDLRWRKERLCRQLEALTQQEYAVEEELRPLKMKLDRIRDEKEEVIAQLIWIENQTVFEVKPHVSSA